MEKRKYPLSLFVIGFIMHILIDYCWILIPAIIFIVVGIFVRPCLYIGLLLLLLNLILSFVSQMKLRKEMLTDSDNPDFRKFQDVLSKDGNWVENVKAFVEEADSEAKKWQQLSLEELLVLADDELTSAIWARICNITDEYEEVEDGFAELNQEQKDFYAVYYYELEVNNGGLCQFFTNSSRAIAPYLSDALARINARKHKELFDKFIADNKINVKDLESFAVSSVKDFEKQCKRYDFDSYDDAFYELDAFEEYLCDYVRKHIEKF